MSNNLVEIKPEHANTTRVSKACDQCSRYRRRCDGNTPCQLCIAKGRTCVYTRVMKKRGPEAKKLQKLKSQVIELTRKVEIALADGIQSWNHEKFLKILTADKYGRLLSLVDLYFVNTYVSLPLLSRQWIIDNFADIPLHLLHSMYVAALMATNLPEYAGTAVKHAKYLKKILLERIEDCDPFILVSLIHLAYYEFTSANKNSSLAHIAFAIKMAQAMGLDSDKQVVWASDSTGRILGTEFGLDKQFLRSIWFLLYLWDNNNHLMFGIPTLISAGIPDNMILTYVSPNIGDSSNIPQNFLTHNLYVMPLMNLGKLAITVTNYDQCFQLLNHFDSYNANMPISYLVLTPLWLGRTINWINELYHYFRFKILINLFFVCKERNDQGVQEFIQFQMMKSINTVLLMSTGFVSFFNGQPQKFGTYMFFSKVLNISLISYCVIGRDTFEGIRDSIVEQLVSAIKLTGTPQDEDILERAIGDREFAVKSLGGLFDHLL